ncbi:TOBE domain-containing protein [Natrarchaeobaculum sulfurireducens]|uniref:DNA-binding domain of ModE / Molybdate-bindingdomain of ModE n=1 Tax=Natrarchaeobaculum sulfurireducens TaxID=2044521 RepID=A0A346PPJ4_9EURY|nr:TOBE domain-containing protein [Natrarchaeobaculum sulfurireducens]AXR78508.1 N-terminal domain of molybdenum-binding protein [Natrarchaeobaculum sulfurireducens]AXR81439.1 DNA-binding domain of ModE / Molybdate-bindingdomain of ModE [Natrarchaeobaculum sulfurireducens]
MTIEKGYKAELTVDDITIDRRDIEMLESIDQHGSLHAAAESLGRSYAHLQRRVVELEAVLGALTVRRRGGKGGGGTDLTETAREVLQQFERHQTELEGVARVTESVFTETVQNRTGELGTVATAAGPVVVLVPDGVTTVQVTVRSDTVVLSDPTVGDKEKQTSFRNQFLGTVSSIETAEAVANVTLELEGGIELQTLITHSSLRSLAIEMGNPIHASFKATAARAIPLENES